MTLQIRAAQLKDLAAIETVYRRHAHEVEGPAYHGGGGSLKRQVASTRLWFLLNHTFASILPITSAADQVYVGEDEAGEIQGFVQAEAAPAGKHVWQILNLCLVPGLDRFKAGTALLDHLCNEGLKHGAQKFMVRLSQSDPTADLFKARGFNGYATEHALLHESVDPRPAPALSGWRAMQPQDRLALYLLYRAVTPALVSAAEAVSFKEWSQSFHGGSWTGAPTRLGRPRQFVVDRTEVIGWMGIAPGSGGRPHTLGLMARPEPAELWPALVQRALAYVAEHRPGPVWCSLRHYDQRSIQLLQQEGFEVIASQILMVRELGIKVTAPVRGRVRAKRLVPQYT